MSKLDAKQLASALRSNVFNHYFDLAHEKISEKYDSLLEDVQSPEAFHVHLECNLVPDVITALEAEGFIVNLAKKGGTDITLPEGELIVETTEEA